MASIVHELDEQDGSQAARQEDLSSPPAASRLPLGVLFVLAGLAALVIPTLFRLAQEYWSTDNGVHGPLILVSGIWLIWRERTSIRLRQGSISPLWLLGCLPLLLLLYAYGRWFGVLFAETASLYALLILLGLYYWGPATMRRLWFAVFYLAFLVRPPSLLVAQLTQPLKIWLSETAVWVLYQLGYEVGNTGVSIQIAQYELLVQQACAGLGSIFTLFAVGLLYLHLAKHGSRSRDLILLLAIIPIAVLSNVVRVISLILLTYHAGFQVAQSLAHEMMGIITFTLALGGMFLLDSALGASWRRRKPPRRGRDAGLAHAAA